MHVVWDHQQARNFLIQHHKLDCFHFAKGELGALLKTLHCIQQDPLNPCGRNQDLVALARLPEYRNGDIDKLLPGNSVDFYAKERCLIEPEAARHIPNCLEENWGSLQTRTKRVGKEMLENVLAEFKEKGPLSTEELQDRAKVQPIDWSGWKGTSKGQKMAAEILWQKTEIATYSQQNSKRTYDVWQRIFPDRETNPRKSMAWLLKRRVQACGLMALSLGPPWGLLKKAREMKIHEELVDDGQLQFVQIDGSSRRYLAPVKLPEWKRVKGTRILGPLDPLIWDRKLIQQIFQFRYVWEVYKPVSQREWGWYVLPILQNGWLVGRLEVNCSHKLEVKNLWIERKGDLDALVEELKRLAFANGLELKKISRKAIHTSKATDLT